MSNQDEKQTNNPTEEEENSYSSAAPEPEEDNEEMNDYQMFNMLIGLVSSQYWPALKRYFDLKSYKVEQSLFAIDPFKEPTYMARAQGQRNAYYELETDISNEIQRRKRKEEETTGEKEVDSEYNPGYNKF